MLFNSFEFFLFFPIVTILYFLLPHKLRWFHLLVASCLFYMAFVPIYILILFGTIIIDYIAGILIENAVGRKRKAFLVMSIVANVGALVFFKYFNFFVENINDAFHLFSLTATLPLLKIILPIGLSFHTFQAMSYTIEVYRGNQKAERHFGIYALYVMFYPQLVAGPIERPQNLLHQFHEKHIFDYDEVVSGLRQMMWGLIKKIVIADRIAILVDPIYNNPRNFSGIAIAIAAIFFAFQLYCDFSGYSDIALGSARVMGIKLMVNFYRPFSSRTIGEFWRKWHISLSSWFFDYVFNPFVISFRSLGRNTTIVAGLLVTFLLSGIWHGAGWKFMLFGLTQGVAVVYEYLTRRQRKELFEKLPQWLNDLLSKVITFIYLVLSWVFFRANSMKDVFVIFKKFGDIPRELAQVFATKKIAFLNLPGINNIIFPCILLVVFLEVENILQSRYKLAETFSKKPAIMRWAVYYSGIAILIYYGVYENRQFIYFQF
jgi:alginate O-acetyltransferase complex protein AlgI